MKKTILAVLMMTVIITIPCFAQEVETDGILSIEGTLWRFGRYIMFSPIPPFFYTFNSNSRVGFHQGTVYVCYEECHSTTFTYINSPVLSISYLFDSFLGYSLYIMQPIGWGIATYFGSSFSGSSFYYLIAMMFKVEDNWTPPEDEPTTESNYIFGDS